MNTNRDGQNEIKNKFMWNLKNVYTTNSIIWEQCFCSFLDSDNRMQGAGREQFTSCVVLSHFSSTIGIKVRQEGTLYNLNLCYVDKEWK